MTKEIRNLNLNIFVNESTDINSMGNDFHVFRLESVPRVDYPIRTEMYVCFLCLRGYANGRINLVDYKLEQRSMCITLSRQILEIESVSDDFCCLCVLTSKNFVTNLGLSFNLDVYRSIIENPVIVLNKEPFESMITYYNMVSRILHEKDNPNSTEVIRHLTCAYFYGIGYYFYRATESSVSNEGSLVRKFMNEVQASYRKERKVIYYAERLHLTPKYLSTVVKSYSGKTASEWIDDYVILEAKALLKSTNLTIQQISEELNFPSQSFFGKYFKRLVGESPKSYRDSK